MWKIKHHYLAFGGYRACIGQGPRATIYQGCCLRSLNRALTHLDHVPAGLIWAYRRNRHGQWVRFSVRRWRSCS